jgi:hypothetical protein
MTNEEFNEWLRHHTAAFPGMAAWLNKLPQKRDTLAAWEYALRAVDLDAAKRATDLMLSGEEAQPAGWGSYPAAIRAIAMRLCGERRQYSQPRTIDGQPTYECAHCQDEGWVMVYHRNALRWAHAGDWAGCVKKFGRKVIAAKPCCCWRGTAIAKANKLEAFDSTVDIDERDPYYYPAEIARVQAAAKKSIQWDPDRPLPALEF